MQYFRQHTQIIAIWERDWNRVGGTDYKLEFIRTNITTQEREKDKGNFAEFIICKIIAELEANLSYSLLTIGQCQLETNSTLKFKQKIKCFILVIF